MAGQGQRGGRWGCSRMVPGPQMMERRALQRGRVTPEIWSSVSSPIWVCPREPVAGGGKFPRGALTAPTGGCRNEQTQGSLGPPPGTWAEEGQSRGGEARGHLLLAPQAAGQSEPYYTNLTLQTWSLREEPVPPRQAEVEYSMLVSQVLAPGRGLWAAPRGVGVGREGRRLGRGRCRICP